MPIISKNTLTLCLLILSCLWVNLTFANSEIESLTALAEKGDSEAQYQLGNRYTKNPSLFLDNNPDHGDSDDVSDDSDNDNENENEKYIAELMATGIKWYKLAIEQGNVNAKNSLAELYIEPQSAYFAPQLAFDLFHQAAMQGNKYSQYSLAILYLNGIGVSRDIVTGYAWLRTSAYNYRAPSLLLQEDLNNARNRLSEELFKQAEALAQQYIAQYPATY